MLKHLHKWFLSFVKVIKMLNVQKMHSMSLAG
jgi:hypothetical protein